MLDLLYRRFARRVLAYLTVVVNDAELATDLVHDVFLKASESASQFGGEPSAVAAWLLVIARNTAIDHGRRNGRTVAEPPEAISRRCESGGAASGEEEHAELRTALARLPADQRKVVMLRYHLDMSAGETAKTLGKSVDAVRHTEARALHSLRARLEPLRHSA